MSLIFVIVLILVLLLVFLAGVKFHALFVAEAEAALAEAQRVKAEVLLMVGSGKNSQAHGSSANSPVPGVTIVGAPKPKV